MPNCVSHSVIITVEEDSFEKDSGSAIFREISGLVVALRLKTPDVKIYINCWQRMTAGESDIVLHGERYFTGTTQDQACPECAAYNSGENKTLKREFIAREGIRVGVSFECSYCGCFWKFVKESADVSEKSA
jgi:hypothetical protein